MLIGFAQPFIRALRPLPVNYDFAVRIKKIDLIALKFLTQK